MNFTKYYLLIVVGFFPNPEFQILTNFLTTLNEVFVDVFLSEQSDWFEKFGIWDWKLVKPQGAQIIRK